MIKRKSSRPKNRRSARRRSLKTKAKRKNHKKKTQRGGGESTTAKFPRHSVEKALRIPRAIIEQNAGRECSDEDSSRFVGVGFNGPYKVELSSAIKYGFLMRAKSVNRHGPPPDFVLLNPGYAAALANDAAGPSRPRCARWPSPASRERIKNYPAAFGSARSSAGLSETPASAKVAMPVWQQQVARMSAAKSGIGGEVCPYTATPENGAAGPLPAALRAVTLPRFAGEDKAGERDAENEQRPWRRRRLRLAATPGSL